MTHVAPVIGTPYPEAFLFSNNKNELNPWVFSLYDILNNVNYTDANIPSLYGMAIIGTTSTNFNDSSGTLACAGRWQFTYNDTDPIIWTDLGVSNGYLNASNALLLTGDAYLRYLPANQYEANVTVEFFGWDQYGTTAGHESQSGVPSYWNVSNEPTAFSDAIGNAIIWVNQAPSLTSTTSTLTPCAVGQMDVFNSIFDLLTTLGYSGSEYQNSATPPGQRGIAITGLSATNGTWYYYNQTTDSAVDMTPLISSLSDNNAAVIGQLFNNTEGFLQFSPASADATGSIQFYAWDCTQFYDPSEMISPPAWNQTGNFVFLDTRAFSETGDIGGSTPFGTQRATVSTTSSPPSPPEEIVPQNLITQVNVTVNTPPIPNKLQSKICFISHGGTTTSNSAITLISSMLDITNILGASVAITSIAWSSNVVTVQTSAPHGLSVGDNATVVGVTPTAYNGTFAVASIPDSTHITYALLSNPGSETVLGTLINADVAEVKAMFTTYFAQGSNYPAYVMELGSGTAASRISAFSTYLTANPGSFYVYVVPRGWDAESTFVTLVGNYNSNTDKVYFYVTTTLSTYTSFITKNVYMLIEAPTIPVTEFTIAFRAYWVASQNPSSTNQVPPSSYSFALGVTPYPVTNVQKTTFETANLNYIGTGAEGGIANTIDFHGVLANGNPVNMWYSIDWVQINEQLVISNAIINGSNRQPPLYYNQPGIDLLQRVAGQLMANSISYGLTLGTLILTKLPQSDFIANVNAGKYLGNAVVNAEPFSVYTNENPNDYAIGQYNGLTAVYTPQLGFKHIVFNLDVNLFA